MPAQTVQGNLESLSKIVKAYVWPPRTLPRLRITSSLKSLALSALPNSDCLPVCIVTSLGLSLSLLSYVFHPFVSMLSGLFISWLQPYASSLCLQPFPLSILVGPPLTTTILFSPTQTARYLGLTWRSIPPWSLCV